MTGCRHAPLTLVALLPVAAGAAVWIERLVTVTGEETGAS
jgi:hypothetical protein